MPGCLLSGPSCHKGIPARAWPTILACFTSRAFVARSEEVIPPYYILLIVIDQNEYILSLSPPYRQLVHLSAMNQVKATMVS